MLFTKRERAPYAKRLYLNNIEEFQQYFDKETLLKVQEILAELHKNKK